MSFLMLEHLTTAFDDESQENMECDDRLNKEFV
jgi:hypothetical protein